MRVSDLMNTNPLLIDKNETLVTALEKALDKGVSHIIAVKEGKIVGVMSEKDVILKLASLRLRQTDPSRLHISSFINTDVKVTSPDTPVREAINIMLKENIGCLPVVDSKKNVLGLITKHDLIRLAFDIHDTLVSAIATFNLVTLKPESKILQARSIILDKKYSSIPVIEEEKLRGILTDTRVMEALVKFQQIAPWRHRKERIHHLLAKDVMDRNPPTVSPSTPISEVAKTLHSENLKSLILVEDEKPIGIVTKTDILSFLVRA